MNILLDASAIMAIILNEPNKGKAIELTEDATLFCPEIMSFEIGNALVNLYKRGKITEKNLIEAYKEYVSIPFKKKKINISKALEIACKYKIYAYDAYYLDIACRLDLPLITFDKKMQSVGTDLKITILNLEEQDESI